MLILMRIRDTERKLKNFVSMKEPERGEKGNNGGPNDALNLLHRQQKATALLSTFICVLCVYLCT